MCAETILQSLNSAHNNQVIVFFFQGTSRPTNYISKAISRNEDQIPAESRQVLLDGRENSSMPRCMFFKLAAVRRVHTLNHYVYIFVASGVVYFLPPSYNK